MISYLALVDGDTEFVFQDSTIPNRDEVIWTSLKVGSPDIRASVQDRVGSDGTYDRTQFHGARNVSLECRLSDAPASKLDTLLGFLHPHKRPYLVLTDSDWVGSQTRRLLLRSDQWSDDITNTSSWWRDVQLQWVAPDGVWESFDLYSYSVEASGGATGRVYDLVSPRTYPVSGGSGVISVYNPGSSQVDWVARLYGPCTGPRLTNDHTGEALVFKSSFSLGAGEFVEVNSRDFTVFANGDSSLSRTHQLSFGNSVWWRLDPGSTNVRYNPISGVDAGCRAEFEFRPTWL